MYHFIIYGIKALQLLYYFMWCALQSDTEIVAFYKSDTKIVVFCEYRNVNTYTKCSTFACRIIECYKYCIILRNYHKSATFCVVL